MPDDPKTLADVEAAAQRLREAREAALAHLEAMRQVGERRAVIRGVIAALGELARAEIEASHVHCLGQSCLPAVHTA